MTRSTRPDSGIQPDDRAAWEVLLRACIAGDINELTSRVRAAGDVTERRHLEDRFRALADALPQLVWIADHTGSIFWYNQRWYDFTGMSLEDLQGWGWQQVHHPEHVHRVTLGMRQSFRTGDSWEDTLRLRSCDGSWHWFLGRAQPIRGTDRAVEFWIGTHTDITDLREAQLARDRALQDTQAERERLYDLFRLAPAAIAVVEGKEHTVRVANSPFFRLIGNRRLFGLPVADALPELRGQELVTLLDRACEHGHALTRSELRLRIQPRPDAPPAEHTLDIVVQPLHDTQRNIFAAMIHAVDVTARVQATEELARARADAERANATKSAFLATLSHDLRTPLTAVNGYASLMSEGIYGPVTTRQREALRKMCQANSHLLALIEDILQFAKLEAGKVDLRLSPVDVGHALAQAVAMIAPQLDAKQLHFECRVPHDLGAIYTDPDRLTQIIVNLLTNAVKFTNAGTITLDADLSDRFVRIRVGDTGAGIGPDQLAVIFNPFVQAGVSTGGRQGIGLGLAIGRQLARAMNGDLTVESEQGRGSTFTLTLPRP